MVKGIEGNRCAGPVLAVGDSCTRLQPKSARYKDVHEMLGLRASARDLSIKPAILAAVPQYADLRKRSL
jgi:hypothetical protein